MVCRRRVTAWSVSRLGPEKRGHRAAPVTDRTTVSPITWSDLLRHAWNSSCWRRVVLMPAATAVAAASPIVSEAIEGFVAAGVLAGRVAPGATRHLAIRAIRPFGTVTYIDVGRGFG